MSNRLTKTVFGVILGSGIVLGMASAHSETTGNAEADYRIGEMKKLGMNMGAIGKVAKGEVAYSDALNQNAKAIAQLSANMSKWFPAGSGVEKSRSKPDIWDESNKDKFAKAIEDLQAASLQLIVAVQSGDQAKIGGALKATGATCGGCHKPFRKPKE
ncbi:MAG: cytochrome c [Sneathiella sp.]|uniref:c-type cytochrome n=1 Tax=Sneathiella sp. TaxID=1964365 RepID=UPI0030028E6A